LPDFLLTSDYVFGEFNEDAFNLLHPESCDALYELAFFPIQHFTTFDCINICELDDWNKNIYTLSLSSLKEVRQPFSVEQIIKRIGVLSPELSEFLLFSEEADSFGDCYIVSGESDDDFLSSVEETNEKCWRVVMLNKQGNLFYILQGLIDA